MRGSKQQYHRVEAEDGQAYFVKTGRPRYRYASEYLYSGLVPHEYLNDTYGIQIPKTTVLKFRDTQHVGIEFIDDIIFSLSDELQEGSKSSLLKPQITQAVALLDIALMNSDRYPYQVVWSENFRGSSGYVWIDHDHAVIGDGDIDLARFRRDVAKHPHTDYIRHPIFQPTPEGLRNPEQLLQALLDSFRRNFASITSDLLDAGLVSNDAVRCMEKFPLWWQEVSRRLGAGELFEGVQA